MAARWFRQTVVIVLLAFIGLAGCSSSEGDFETAGTSVPETAVPQTAIPQTAVPQTAVPQTAVSEPAGTEPPEAEADPVRPYGDAPTTTIDYVDTSVWISRVEMTASSIEVQWGEFDGAVTYVLHRMVRESDQQPDPAAMTAETAFYTATEAGRIVDEEVIEGTRYWYGLRALDSEGAAIAHGWHRADAVTDVEPPSPVEVVSAEVVDGEILVTWVEPDENYELHAYRILRIVDGGEPEILATTWNLDQRSLLDDSAPAGGDLSYAVQALDFHWNLSEPAPIEVQGR